MPKIIVIMNEAWPVYDFGSLPDGLKGTEIDAETYSRWRDVITAYRGVQAELAKHYHDQESA
jgi:hypothetical protein